MKGVMATVARANRKFSRGSYVLTGSALVVLILLLAVVALVRCEKEKSPPVEGLVCYCPCDDCTGYEIIADEPITVEELKKKGYEEQVPLWDPEARRVH